METLVVIILSSAMIRTDPVFNAKGWEGDLFLFSPYEVF